MDRERVDERWRGDEVGESDRGVVAEHAPGADEVRGRGGREDGGADEPRFQAGREVGVAGWSTTSGSISSPV
jgi:hypothetical protein